MRAPSATAPLSVRNCAASRRGAGRILSTDLDRHAYVAAQRGGITPVGVIEIDDKQWPMAIEPDVGLVRQPSVAYLGYHPTGLRIWADVAEAGIRTARQHAKRQRGGFGRPKPIGQLDTGFVAAVIPGDILRMIEGQTVAARQLFAQSSPRCPCEQFSPRVLRGDCIGPGPAHIGDLAGL